MILGFVVFRVGLERFFSPRMVSACWFGVFRVQAFKGWGFVGLGVLIGF